VGNRIACRQGGHLQPPVVQERIAAYHERVGSIANKSRESSLDLAAGAGPNDIDLHPGGRRRRHVFHHPFNIRIGWIDQQSDARGCGEKFAQ